jgi:tape measure domain-containing protein
MASVAALNVRIGGDIKALEKALKDAERAVKKSGAQLSAIGNDITLKMTLPMLAFGAAAIKSAGEIEAIEKAMQATFAGAGRSIEEANAELVALRKAAEAPGLDFEQAVKASLRLQGVGFSAEKARNTIIQLANAISTTGGTAENLNGVTVQFAQIISKGKILTSDLNVIKENMPGLAKIMKETFGTTSAEDLRALGVNGQEFVEKITAAMQKLPRVEGGISNAIVNAGVAVKMFLAEVGESLNKTFNVTGKLEAFSKFLTDLGDKFSGMSEGTQRAIAAVGVFALALGPMLKVGQFAVLAIGQMIAVFGALQKVLLQSLAGQAIPGAIAAFKALDMATKLTIVGAAIGMVLALAAAFTVLRKDTSDAAKAQEQISIVEKMAANSVAEQMVKVNILTATLNNNVSSLDAKKRALKELNVIAPEYFGKLKIGGDITKDVTTANEAFRESLMKNARAIAAQEQLIAIEKELNIIRLKRGTFSGEDKVALGMLGIATNTTEALKKQKEVLDKLEAPLNAQKEVLYQIAEENKKVAATTDTVTNAAGNTGGIDTRAKAWEELMKSVHAADMAEKEIRGTMEYQDIKGSSAPVDQIAGIATPKAADPDFATKFEASMERMKAAAASAAASISANVEGIDTKMQRWADNISEKLGGGLETTKEGLAAIGGLSDAISARNIDNLNKEMEARLQGVKKGSALEAKIKEEFQAKIDAMERKAARRAKVLAIMEATITAAQGVLKGLAKGSIPGAIAAGAIGAIQIARIIATPLAKGGIVSGPTHALVGEYPGAANNPEVVAPLDKLKGMLGGAASDINVSGTFRVQGTDLLLVLEKAQKGRGRVAGY